MPLGVLWRWLRDAWVSGGWKELTVGCACSRRVASATWWISSGFAPNELMCGVLSDSMRVLPNSIDEAWEFFLALLVKQWRRHRRVWLLSQRVLPSSADEALDGSLARSVQGSWLQVSGCEWFIEWSSALSITSGRTLVRNTVSHIDCPHHSMIARPHLLLKVCTWWWSVDLDFASLWTFTSL